MNFRNTRSTREDEGAWTGGPRREQSFPFEYGAHADGAQRRPIARRRACAARWRATAPPRARGGLANWTLAPTLRRGKRIRLDSVATKATSGRDRRSIGRSRATASATAAVVAAKLVEFPIYIIDK